MLKNERKSHLRAITKTMNKDKLYLITRDDLVPGSQAVQAMHAARQFQAEHSEIEQRWFNSSNHLCFLSVPSVQDLEKLVRKAERRGVLYSTFQEPDLENQMTAIALEPGQNSRRLCGKLKLALS